MMKTKNDFRVELKKRRKAFAQQQQFFDPFRWPRDAFLQALQRSEIVAGYSALAAEPDVIPILEFLRNDGKIIALPAMIEGEAMDFRNFDGETPLTRSAQGFFQPSADAPLLMPDVILVPVVGFDRHFNRLGHGKGHFDRALANRPNALKIGVAWSVQEVPDLPVDPWDVPLDAMLTEREWRVRGDG